MDAYANSYVAAAHTTEPLHALALVHATANAWKNIPANESLSSFAGLIADVIVNALATVLVHAIAVALAATIASALANMPENIPDENSRNQKNATVLKIENPERLDSNALSEMHSQHF